MRKRITTLLFVFTMLIMFSSCSSSSPYGVWKNMCEQYPDQKGKIQEISYQDKAGYYIRYEGVDYYEDELSLFYVTNTIIYEAPEGDVLVGWDSFPLIVIQLDQYFSYQSDNPIYIYRLGHADFYLSADYHYETDTFVIEGTEKEFVFGDMFSLSDDFSYDPIFTRYPSQTTITFYSKQLPQLKMDLYLFCVDNKWYAGGRTSSKALFEVSDELLNMLNTDDTN